MINKQKKYCTFYITRHGETEWNVKKIIQGHKDSPLTKNGISQAKKVSKELRNIKFDRVFSSDLIRARRTAEIIVADHDIAVKTNKLLRESRFGRFDGKKIDSFIQQVQEAIKHRDSLSEKEIMTYKIHPDVESYEELSTRMITFLREVSIVNIGKTILVVAHAGIIRATLVKLGFATDNQLPHGSIGNTSYAIVESDGVDFFVKETKGIKKADL